MPAADDNASGVAGLVELAAMFGRQAPGCTLELVAYCTEEPPFFATPDMGSVHHARLLKSSGAEVRGVIVLETIGFFSDEAGSQQYPSVLLRLFYPSTGDYIGIVGNMGHTWLVRQVKRAMRAATDLPVRSINAPSFVPGVDFSDHRSYWDAGFQAVMVTDTAFYRNRAYHTWGDTPDRLDYRRMAKVVVGVYEAIRSLAQ
jgi:Zn-dependent M28 family amino/carboxypeptidase